MRSVTILRLLPLFAVLFALSLVVMSSSVVRATGDEPLSESKLRTLTKQFRTILTAENPKKSSKAWSKAKKNAKRLTADQLESVLAAAGMAESMKPGFQHGIAFTSNGETFEYSVHCPPKPKSRLLPLVVDAGHASLAEADTTGLEDVMSTWLSVSGSKDDVIFIRTRVLDRLTNEGRYDAMSKPKVGGSQHGDWIARAILDAIADASKRFPVDPNRVYVQGISQTGFWAWQLGAFAPGRFAAICPVGAVTWQIRERYPNFRNLPVFILHGENDETCPFVQAKAAADKLKELEFPVDFRPVTGGEHVKNTFPRWRAMWPDVAKKVRDPWPKHVTGTIVSAGGRDLHWIEVGGISAKSFDLFQPVATIDAKVEGQTITISATGAKELRLALSSKLLDVTVPITVIVNEKRVFEGVPKVDAKIALERAARTGDFAATGGAFVTVKVR